MVTDLTLSAVQHVCFRMRDSDKTEIYALRAHDSPVLLADEVMRSAENGGRMAVIWRSGLPVAVVGYIPTCPGIWDICMFGTDELPRLGSRIALWFRRNAIDLVRLGKMHRVQCPCRVGHHEAHDMIERLGGWPEGVMRQMGKDRGDYTLYSWVLGKNDEIVGRGKDVLSKQAA